MTTLDLSISQAEAEAFLYREARLSDCHDYDAWESLWTDDAIYWVPAGGDSENDPISQVSVLFDNRSRIATRVRQLKSGKRHSQTPRSHVVHVISNVELLGAHPGDAHSPPTHVGDVVVAATMLVVESRERGTTHWAARCEYRLRRVDGELRLSYKKVLLSDREQALSTLSFLI
ncbi:MAG: aromatic-ring-hydroxylating dioxygenase subunit beta [Sporichthyaceae bacterium]